jgi:hypothetical protein
MGSLSESIVMSYYLSKGATVSLPFGGHARYDLVVDLPGIGLSRVQVKTLQRIEISPALPSKYTVSIIVTNSDPSKVTSRDGLSRIQYSLDEVDMFAVVDPHGSAVYVFPAAFFLDRSSVLVFPYGRPEGLGDPSLEEYRVA